MLYGSGMKRALFLSFVAALTATAACGGGGDKSFESLCTTQVPPPAACQTTCDPTAGAAVSCPSGFHCATGGKCDSVCTPGGTECGTGFTCTADGFCKDPSSSGSPDAGGTVGGSDPDAACIDLKFTTTRVIPSIQLLIDKSGSMAADFANDKQKITPSNPAKFATEQTALVGADGIVTKLEASVYFGASMFPSDEDNTCLPLYTVPRALKNQANIAALFTAHGPNGGTPTPDAMRAVIQDFADNPPPSGSPPVIVLATDGLPNTCTTETDTRPESVDAVKAAFAAGIKVYVLSVGTVMGSDTHFQDLANAGLGVTSGAKVFTGTSPADLASAFDEIIRGVVSCDLNLTNGTVNQDDAASGTVTVDGTKLTYLTDWTLDPSGAVIHVIGAACTALKSAANPVVDATFPCGGGVIF